MISPDNKWLYVPDLGLDKVMIYQFDDKSGKLSPGKQPYVAAEPGAGPRHFVFNPNGKYAYLIHELNGQVAAYKYKKGELTLIERVSSTDPAKKGFAGSADIHLSPDRKFLYASNRGDFNDLVWYKIEQSTGKLSVAGFQSTLGKTPRNFDMDPSGNFLLAANQGSNEIVIFQRNKTTGALTDTGKRIAVGQPVCIKRMKTR
jgi:6-phosphogluconolactonase